MELRPHEKKWSQSDPKKKIKKWTSTTFCLKLFKWPKCHLLGNMKENVFENSCDKPSISTRRNKGLLLHFVPLGAIEIWQPTTYYKRWHDSCVGPEPMKSAKDAWKVQRLLNTLVTNGHVVMVGWGLTWRLQLTTWRPHRFKCKKTTYKIKLYYAV